MALMTPSCGLMACSEPREETWMTFAWLLRHCRWATLGCLLAPVAMAAHSAEPCSHYQALRQPFFGDLHIHTRYSFDSFLSNQKNDPDGAYRYAKGEAITLPDPFGEQTLTARIDRPIDFAAVTDHGQFLGEVALCDSSPSQLAW